MRFLDDQEGMATRRELYRGGMSVADVRAEIDATRWRAINEVVVCTHNGPLTPIQQRWAVILSAQGPTALCGLTALQDLGLHGFETPEIHALIQRGAHASTPRSGLMTSRPLHEW